MFNQNLKDKYQFLTNYFEAGIKNPNRSIAQSILFYGQDISTQYEFATEIARLLNCKEGKSQDCECLNCKWIRNKEHPEVLTISKIDNKPSDDDSKTVISVAQARMIKNLLLNTSDYHRVFIFCDAKMDGEQWIPLGLNIDNMPDVTINALLKTIEEPPANTTFFFLTVDKNDLIETIISRSQSFFVPSYKFDGREYSHVQELMEDYLNLEPKDFLDLAQNLFMVSKEQGNDKIFEEIQNFLLALLKSNLENPNLKNRILKDLKAVKQAKEMVKNHIYPQLALEEMALNIIER